MTCSLCKTENARGTKFCTGCGHRICSNCGNGVDGQVTFCGECGQVVAAPMVSDKAVSSEEDWVVTRAETVTPPQSVRKVEEKLVAVDPPAQGKVVAPEAVVAEPPKPSRGLVGYGLAVMFGLLGAVYTLFANRDVRPFGVIGLIVSLAIFGFTRARRMRRGLAGASSPAAAAKTKDVTRGRVRNFVTRTEATANQHSPSDVVWNWVLDTFDEAGNANAPIPVQMRSARISGFVSNGDEIEIPGAYWVGELLQPSELYNVTTRSVVRVELPKNTVSVGGCLLLLMVPCTIALVAWFVTTH